MDSRYRAALAYANSIRRAHDKEPVKELAVGVTGDIDNSPIIRTIDVPGFTWWNGGAMRQPRWTTYRPKPEVVEFLTAWFAGEYPELEDGPPRKRVCRWCWHTWHRPSNLRICPHCKRFNFGG